MMHQSIKAQLIEAMRAKDAVRLDVLRGLLSSFSNELIAKGSAEPFLDDATVMALIKKSVKQHKDSIDQFTKGGRMDLVEKEVAELKHLEAYLPAAMSKEEILKIATAKKAELNITDKNRLIGVVMKETKGNADGNDVKAAVESLF
jgi:uncharacterized protein YqeY